MNSLKNEIINSRVDSRKNGSQTSEKDGLANIPSPDVNSSNYDPMVDIFELFDTPAALNDINHILKYSCAYQTKLEKEISKEREEYKKVLMESNPEKDYSKLDSELIKILDDFGKLKVNVKETEKSINEMTSSIKKLDHSKRNITFTMTTLKRLQMLVTAYDKLERQMEREKQVKNYKEIKQLLSAVLELNKYFQDFKSIDEVNQLNNLILKKKNHIIDDVMHDFELQFHEELNNDNLVEACYILEMLGESNSLKLKQWYTDAALREINQIFTSSEEAGSLENLSRRYIYFQNILSNFVLKSSKIFPESWHMDLLLVEKFCEFTKKDLQEVLEKEMRLKGISDVNVLLNALSNTLDFEQFLNKKFKYHKDFDESMANPSAPDFTKSISNVFEPYLNIWIDEQSKTIENKLMEFSNPSNLFKKTGDNEDSTNNNIDSGETINVLESAAELFRLYRQMLSQISKLTSGKSLIKLTRLFNRYLNQYQRKILDSILPDSKSLVSVDLENQKEGVDIICLVLNTSSYCSATIIQLEEKIKSLIQPAELSEKVELNSSNDGFVQLIAYCISLLFYKVENDIQIAWKELSNFNWVVLNEVVGESRYVTTLKSIIKEDCDYIFPRLSKSSYIRNLLDRMVDMLLNKILSVVVKLTPVSVIMAEQIKLDLQELKTFVNFLPTITENGEKVLASASFKANVNMKFKQIDNLMKILMVPDKPVDTFINSYFTIIGDSSFSNFMKVLQLKGVMDIQATEKDKFKYMDMFKLQLGSYEDSSHELKESDEFLEKINLANTTLTTVRSHGHKKSNSRSIYLPSTVGSSNLTSNSSSNYTLPNLLTPPEPPSHAILNNGSPAPSSTSTSPRPNFGFFNNAKLDTISIEKNLKAFTENKTNFNEKFQKFFKRGE